MEPKEPSGRSLPETIVTVGPGPSVPTGHRWVTGTGDDSTSFRPARVPNPVYSTEGSDTLDLRRFVGVFDWYAVGRLAAGRAAAEPDWAWLVGLCGETLASGSRHPDMVAPDYGPVRNFVLTWNGGEVGGPSVSFECLLIRLNEVVRRVFRIRFDGLVSEMMAEHTAIAEFRRLRDTSMLPNNIAIRRPPFSDGTFQSSEEGPTGEYAELLDHISFDPNRERDWSALKVISDWHRGQDDEFMADAFAWLAACRKWPHFSGIVESERVWTWTRDEMPGPHVKPGPQSLLWRTLPSRTLGLAFHRAATGYARVARDMADLKDRPFSAAREAGPSGGMI